MPHSWKVTSDFPKFMEISEALLKCYNSVNYYKIRCKKLDLLKEDNMMLVADMVN